MVKLKSYHPQDYSTLASGWPRETARGPLPLSVTKKLSQSGPL